jgi:hypothetical protein
MCPPNVFPRSSYSEVIKTLRVCIAGVLIECVYRDFRGREIMSERGVWIGIFDFAGNG